MKVDYNPLISVIIPIYNVEKFLPQCIESVINQTYQTLEIILVNDGSADTCYDICLRYKDLDSRIIVINKKNEGVGPARNEGIRIAKGEYLYFLDSDDFLENNAFEKLSSYFKQGHDIILFGFNRVNESGDFLNKVLPPAIRTINLKKDKEELTKILRSGTGLAVWDKIIKKDIIKKHSLSFDNKIRGEDFTFIIIIFSKVDSIVSISEAFVNYRILLGRSYKFDDQIIKNHIINFEKLKDLVGQEGEESKAYLNEIFKLWFFRVIPLHISGNRCLSVSQKTLMFNEMFNASILVEFVEKSGLNRNPIDESLRSSFLNKWSLIFMIYGKLIKLVRRLKYK